MSPTAANPARLRGRPAGARRTHRVRLLQAAAELLVRSGAASLTLAATARQAAVTPALAHYYFGNRDGLLAALIDERVAPRVQDLISSAGVRANQPVNALTFLMQRSNSMLLTDRLLRHCIWLPDAPARALRMYLHQALAQLLAQAQDSGRIRADLPPSYLADSLLGLVLFPFLDAADHIAQGNEALAALAMQHIALLQDGILSAHRPRQESSA